MLKTTYHFTKPGIEQFNADTIDDIFLALEDNHPRFDIADLYPRLIIGDKEIEIPLFAEGYEILMDCLRDIWEEDNC